MKKRIISMLLALIMVMSLIPVSASAAGKTISESAITVLKQLQIYSSECKQCGTEWRNGYGTICTRRGEHNNHTDTFNEGTADAALRKKLTELDAAVNSFATTAGITLTQNQHDALVVFSYDVGTSWLNGSGVLRSAVINGTTGNAFLNAIGQSSGMGSDSTDATVGMDRRMIEGNMYLNGMYSNVAPSAYGYVTYDANGGNMAEGTDGKYTQYFDASTLSTPMPVPTKAGYTFLGWYQDNITWVPTLAKYQVGQHLTAKWQVYGAKYTDALTVYNWLSIGTLASNYIFEYPFIEEEDMEIVGIHDEEAVIIDKDYIDSKGYRWGHLQNGEGWVLVNGTVDASVSGSGHEIDVVVTVTNSYVNSRKNATIYSARNGSYSQGDQLRIVNTASADGFLWGQVADEAGNAKGWIALVYTNWSSVKDSASANKPDNVIAEAVVNCQGYLNIRKEAGTDSSIVGALADGDHVDIYEIKYVNGHQWGRTTGGWILLTYAKVTLLDTDLDYSTTTDVLAYTFTGTLKTATIAHTDVSHNSDTVGTELAAGTVVAVSMVKNDEHGDIWGYNGTGWIKLDNVNMDIAKYVVITDSVTVRASANSGSNGVEKVVKGVELDISEIAVVDATIWGYTAKYNGWVNLASKYVQRSNAPTIENADSNVATGLIATVVNTDKVNVRDYGATYGKRIGSLSRGTTVAVWEGNEIDGWYKVDSNQNGVYDYKGDGWVSCDYLDVYYGTIGGDEDSSNGSTSGSNGTSGVVETGMGVVANTYTGVNIRTGAGTGYAATGKYLSGTAVEILEVTSTATSKWGRTAKGWVCMDYITMISKYPIGGTTTGNTTDSNAGQNAGGSTSNTEGNTTTVSTPAVYTGSVIGTNVKVQKTADPDALSIRTLNAGENITIQELVKVTTKKTTTQGTTVDGNSTTQTSTVTTSTNYWARVNDGWIANPEDNLKLNPLDETVYTVVNYEEVNVRNAANGSSIITTLDKGTQVAVTNLEIVDDKVWGYVEDVGTAGGWIRLDNMSQGSISVTEPTTAPTPTTPPVVMGNTSSVGGYVTNTSGYRYTGKVINTNSVNVRANPTTSAAITTTLKYGQSLVVYETVTAENMAWGRCDAGWVYLYYVDLTPVTGAVDARVVYNENTVIYTDMNCSGVAGTYARMSVVDIFEIVGTMARTELGWVSTNDLL